MFNWELDKTLVCSCGRCLKGDAVFAPSKLYGYESPNFAIAIAIDVNRESVAKFGPMATGARTVSTVNNVAGESVRFLCAGAWFTSSPRIGRGKPRLIG